MKKKFIQKMLAAVCATTTIVSMAPSFVSANPHYENIIDKNSQKPEDIERNAIRKLVNDKFTKGILHIFPKSVFFEKNILKAHSTRRFRTFAYSNVKNRFDYQIYYDIGDLEHSARPERHGHLMPLTKHHAPQFKTKFNFLSTKIALINELIENQNDLIKQFLLKYASGDILKIEDQTDMSTKCSDPYYLEEITENVYLHYMRKYYEHYIDREKVDANKKAEHKAAIEEAENYLEKLKIKQEAYKAALLDAEANKEPSFSSEDDAAMKTYYETYAFASAEMHVKSLKGRTHKKLLDQKFQKLYNDNYDKQFNYVVKQMGIRDGFQTDKYQPSLYNLDESAEKSYEEGYIIGAKKRAEENIINICPGQCKTLEYKGIYEHKNAQEAYFKRFKEAIYEEAFYSYSKGMNSLIGDKFNDLIKNNYDDSQTIKDLEEIHKKGTLDGFKESGRKFALTHKPKYEADFSRRFNNIKFKDECKQAYDIGYKQGLAEKNKIACYIY